MVRGLPAFLVFLLDWSFLQMGVEERRGVSTGPGSLGKGSAGVTLGPYHSQALTGSRTLT